MMEDKNTGLNGFDTVENYSAPGQPRPQDETPEVQPDASGAPDASGGFANADADARADFSGAGTEAEKSAPAPAAPDASRPAQDGAAGEYHYSAPGIVQDNAAPGYSDAYRYNAPQRPWYPQSYPQNPYGSPQGQAGYGAAGYGQPAGAAPQQQQHPQPPAPRKKRERRRFSAAAVVAATLCAALLGGAASSVITTRLVMDSSEQGGGTVVSQNGSPTTITVNETEASTVVQAVAEKVTPSVVGIRATVSIQSNPFFGGTQNSTGEGSGIIYSADGYIITNYHVIESVAQARSSYNAKVEVFLPSDPETAIAAEIIGYDSSADLAVLKIDRRGLPAIELGDSDALKVGERAVAVGNPGGLQFMGSVSAGYISGLNRTLQLDTGVSLTLIQTDAAINPGNSGGPLVNSNGQLIGVNSVKIASEEYEGMGFAIPVNTAVEVCNNIITNKDTPKPYIGIEVATQFTAEILQQNGYPAGALISGVTSGTPAEAAGLARGDLITAIDGTEISGYADLAKIIAEHKVGDELNLTVYRDGKSYSVRITLAASNG